jgi:hypothetical protein
MNETGITSKAVAYNSDERFFRKRSPGRIAFALGILLFLMPFAEFKCGNVSIIGNSGLGIALGQPWKIAAGMSSNELMEKIGTATKPGKKMMEDDPNIFALVSLVAALFGLAVSFSSLSWRTLAAICAGILAALMLLAVLIQFKLQMRSLMQNSYGSSEIGLQMGGLLKMSFTAWFFLSLACFIAAAFFNYMYDRLLLHDAISRSMDFEFQEKASSAENT